MLPDDEVCLCFHVSLRKIRNYMARENPSVPSLISECLSAGTGCMWCVPFLKHLHTLHQQGQEPDLRISPEEYMRNRATYRKSLGGSPAAPGSSPVPGESERSSQAFTPNPPPHTS